MRHTADFNLFTRDPTCQTGKLIVNGTNGVSGVVEEVPVNPDEEVAAFIDKLKENNGMYVMLTFLEANGIGVEADNEEVASVGLAVASGTMKYEALLDWVRKHIG